MVSIAAPGGDGDFEIAGLVLYSFFLLFTFYFYLVVLVFRAYFVGNAILAKHELAEVYRVLRSHVQELQDPIALSTYQALETKLELSQILDSQHFAQSYRVRAIANQPIVDLNTLPYPDILAIIKIPPLLQCKTTQQ